MRPTEPHVGDLMKRRFIHLAPGDSLLEAERVMRMARVRVLPVVEGGALVGVLSHQRVLEWSLASESASKAPCTRCWMEATNVRCLMQRVPAVVTPGTSLRVAVDRLLAGSDGCLPVVEEHGGAQALVGILTERDLLRAAFEPTLRG